MDPQEYIKRLLTGELQLGFEPQSYAADVPMGGLPELYAQQFANTRTPFQLPTVGARVPLAGGLEMRGDYTPGTPDYSLGFGYTKRF